MFIELYFVFSVLKSLMFIQLYFVFSVQKSLMLIHLCFVFSVLKILLFIELYFVFSVLKFFAVHWAVFCVLSPEKFAVHSAVFCVLSPSSSLSKIHRWVANGSPVSLLHAASMKCQRQRWMGGAKAWLPCLSSMTLFEWSACSHPSTVGCGRTAIMPTLSLPRLLKTTKGKCWALHSSYGEQGMAQWLERWTHDWKVVGLNPCRSGGGQFSSPWSTVCADSYFSICSTPCSVSIPPHVTTIVHNDPACVCMRARVHAHIVCVLSVCVLSVCVWVWHVMTLNLSDSVQIQFLFVLYRMRSDNNFSVLLWWLQCIVIGSPCSSCFLNTAAVMPVCVDSLLSIMQSSKNTCHCVD